MVFQIFISAKGHHNCWLVSLGLTLSRRKSDWLMPVDICWWLGSKVTMRGMLFSVIGLEGGSSRVSLSRDAALVWDSSKSFMG